MKKGHLRTRRPLTRREGLRQSGRQMKKTPLSPGKKGALERKAIQRAKQIKRRSTETAHFYAKADGRIAFVEIQLVRYPFCEVRALGFVDGSDSCTGRTQVVHETWTRNRQGGRVKDKYLLPRKAPPGASEEEVAAVWEQNRRQFLTLCDRCHDWIHHHPKLSRETFVEREGVSLRLLRRNLEE